MIFEIVLCFKVLNLLVYVVFLNRQITPVKWFKSKFIKVKMNFKIIVMIEVKRKEWRRWEFAFGCGVM